MRKLSAEEESLWAKVARTIEPLSRDPEDRELPPSVRKQIEPPVPRKAERPAMPAHVPPAPRPHHEATLDGGWDRRLASGKVSPDRVIDLHGHRLDGAWDAIDLGLEQAIAAGERVVLLITGHAPRGESPVRRGRIRAAVHDWLGASRHAGDIAAVRAAAPRHGGRGALYVIVRRRKTAR